MSRADFERTDFERYAKRSPKPHPSNTDRQWSDWLYFPVLRPWPETEADFQDQVIEFAQFNGWLVAHFRPARTQQGGVDTWRTPVLADGKGYPDLTMVRRGFRVFAELKIKGRKPSSDQEKWLAELGPSDDRTSVYLWDETEWSEIEEVLS